METLELHRGRLIDHIQLVVRDLAARHARNRAATRGFGGPLGRRDCVALPREIVRLRTRFSEVVRTRTIWLHPVITRRS
jgi:hypothetical protein